MTRAFSTESVDPAVVDSLVDLASRAPSAGKTQGWQGDAWRYYDSIGELRFVANWVGNVMSRAKLVVAKDIDGVLTDISLITCRHG